MSREDIKKVIKDLSQKNYKSAQEHLKSTINDKIEKRKQEKVNQIEYIPKEDNQQGDD